MTRGRVVLTFPHHDVEFRTHRHEGSPDVARRLFAKLAETGFLRSTAIVVRPDGEERAIEFHTRRVREVYVTVMRPIG